jgi:hypothetical protein
VTASTPPGDATSEPVAADPAPPAANPAATDPVVADPVAADPVVAEPPLADAGTGTPIPPGPPGPSGGAIPPGPAGAPVSTPVGGPATGDLVELPLPSVTVARYADYASAQRAVDFLSDNGFPVQRTAIIGTNLRLVESVTGRLTVIRAAQAGAASGAWFGLFIGFLFTLFSSSSWWAVLLVTVIIGAIWGAAFGAIAHALTGGRRDFTSKSTLQAGEYAVTVDAEVADEARTLVTRLTWRTSGAG